MTSSQHSLHVQAERERAIVRDWLLSLMKKSSAKPATKDALRQFAMRNYAVSKASFDAGWDMAIMESGNEHWWKPVRFKRQ